MQREDKLFVVIFVLLVLMFASGLFAQYKLSIIPQEPRIIEVKIPYVVEKQVEKECEQDTKGWFK